MKIVVCNRDNIIIAVHSQDADISAYAAGNIYCVGDDTVAVPGDELSLSKEDANKSKVLMKVRAMRKAAEDAEIAQAISALIESGDLPEGYTLGG